MLLTLILCNNIKSYYRDVIFFQEFVVIKQSYYFDFVIFLIVNKSNCLIIIVL